MGIGGQCAVFRLGSKRVWVELPYFTWRLQYFGDSRSIDGYWLPANLREGIKSFTYGWINNKRLFYSCGNDGQESL
ncbi:hypothetical protein MPNT_10012 [Candidatus Methylacidithermus pantelleriae]|uniref:Uncharacterized protein n=1 Tax=Candidatus Methylacidithermus pantelleriae TaxID=2744239 RepID=A0A8J2BJV3_9BACT|nr:hypothetical protein MPNT_10012 [Candidatus Methylacidithermus pantelleriae]